MFASMALAVSAVFLSAVPGRTWIVDARGGGDFTTIQAAIDAATDGDLVAVVPSADYDGFLLDKKITLYASTGSFVVTSPVTVADIAAGNGGAVIAGMDLMLDVVPNDLIILEVRDCAGEVLLERVYVDTDAVVADLDSGGTMRIADSSSVALTDFSTSTYTAANYWDEPLLTIERSSVRAASLEIWGGTPGYLMFWAYDGQPAIAVYFSSFVVANPKIIGGSGKGGFKCFGWGDLPGDGAIGMIIGTSDVHILGGSSNLVQGGPGGVVDETCDTSPNDVGDPGVGIYLGNSDVVVSKVTIIDGHSSSSWPDWIGDTLIRDDKRPYLSVEPGLQIGTSGELRVGADTKGWALLLLSDQGGNADPGPKWVGPPLFVIAGLIYEIIDLGRTDSTADVVVALDVPDDPSLVGLTYHFQAAFFDDFGRLMTTNSASLTATE